MEVQRPESVDEALVALHEVSRLPNWVACVRPLKQLSTRNITGNLFVKFSEAQDDWYSHGVWMGELSNRVFCKGIFSDVEAH
ncbi:hypothetical protein IFM89_012007 [Coptis chinensis]|uniref:Uncharacterized protein n=1 Tax=Coptis chinensis TaxID=261450 RepID=A0A835IVI6_9MAGN|nr:hypothetical protein IFM89_012007 [Coptis chinensis]